MEQIVKTNHSTPAPVEVPSAGPAPFQADLSSRNLARAVSLYIQGDSEHALEALNGAEAGSNESSLTEITAAKAHLQFELQRYEDAAASYTRLAALSPKDSDVRSSLGLCLQNLGRYAEAVESFRQALALGAKALEMQLAIGACLLHLNEPQEAREAFDAALSRVPDSEAAMFGKAVALQMGWEFEEAAQLYQRILDAIPRRKTRWST